MRASGSVGKLGMRPSRPLPIPMRPALPQDAYRHLGLAPLHYEVYRRQHTLPIEPWRLMVHMARGALNSVMMCGAWRRPAWRPWARLAPSRSAK